jgi:hypothetical protein
LNFYRVEILGSASVNIGCFTKDNQFLMPIQYKNPRRNFVVLFDKMRNKIAKIDMTMCIFRESDERPPMDTSMDENKQLENIPKSKHVHLAASEKNINTSSLSKISKKEEELQTIYETPGVHKQKEGGALDGEFSHFTKSKTKVRGKASESSMKRTKTSPSKLENVTDRAFKLAKGKTDKSMEKKEGIDVRESINSNLSTSKSPMKEYEPSPSYPKQKFEPQSPHGITLQEMMGQTFCPPAMYFEKKQKQKEFPKTFSPEVLIIHFLLLFRLMSNNL